ncbi:winged helix-turn-helix transcriptional regulator [Georgenia alba]|uniref:Winged helix-turn-helix transcriptional regulator n=1 Tax=Georgenia alba TaxID=2233858 RepID=A0ABW2Q8I9_9MICO
MTGKRWYDDACGLAQALNVVGERWALLIVRELVLGAKRFADLRADLPGISSNVLSQRLGELEERGVVRRRRIPPPAASTVYELTEWGAELEPVICVLGHWGARSPVYDGAVLSCTSAVMSQRTMFRADAAPGLSVAIGLRMPERDHVRPFRAQVEDGTFTIDPVEELGPDVDAVVTATPAVLADILYEGREVSEAIEVGDLTVEGDRSAFERYVGCFWLPQRAEAG